MELLGIGLILNNQLCQDCFTVHFFSTPINKSIEF